METSAFRPPRPSRPRRELRLARGQTLVVGGEPLVMGVVNVTPDSFSDGGRWLDHAQAVDKALALLDEGADLIDLGAESTRPGGGVYGAGAATVPAAEELARLLPVLERLRPRTSAPLSVDTRKGTVARAALAAGADLVNDVSLLKDPELGHAVAEAGCPVILMHSRGETAVMQREIHFEDLLREVKDELADAAGRAIGLGVARDQIVLDPGIGFGKTFAQNLELIRHLDELATLGFPILLGASRKSFLGAWAALPGQPPIPPAGRLPGSLAAAAWARARGADILRVHDVAETVQFLRVWRAFEATPDGETA